MQFEQTEDKYKIGILSYNIHTFTSNYGAILHSFAFQKFLDKYNITNIIIDYNRVSYYKMIIRTIVGKPHTCLFKIPALLLKKYLCYKFALKNMRITKNQYQNNDFDKDFSFIDAFCMETDILWTRSGNTYDEVMMCEKSAMKNKLNFSYCVDFGRGEISKEHGETLKKYANNFKYISIRNLLRLKEYQEKTNRYDAVCTIDPILLLDAEDYSEIIDENFSNKQDYILVYNCKEDNNEMVIKAKEFAKENHLKVKLINCCDTKIKNELHSIPTLVGVERFLGLLKNAKYVFTNSYHGICFSIIFKKDFYAFSRIANSEKILTLLEQYGLNNRLIKQEIKISPINYEQVYNKLQQLREYSVKRLLNVVENI